MALRDPYLVSHVCLLVHNISTPERPGRKGAVLQIYMTRDMKCEPECGIQCRRPCHRIGAQPKV